MTILTTLESVFADEGFTKDLTNIMINIKDYANLVAENEKSIETQFDMHIFSLFQTFFKPLGYQYNPHKEKNIVTYKSGFIDTALTNVLIEFKQPSTLSSERDKKSAIEQTLNYLNGENKDNITKTFAVVTDGNICAILTVDENGKIRFEDYTNITYEHYERIIKAIVGLNQKTFDSNALVEDFAPVTKSPIRELTLLLYKTINKVATPKTLMLLKEWKNLFKLSHDDHSQQKDILKRQNALQDYLGVLLNDIDSEYNALFALQTAYSILIKLIAFKVVSQIKFDNSLVDYSEMLKANSIALQSKMMELESGSIIRDYGVQNLLEGDFFSWYATPQQWNNEIADSIKIIIAKLNKYTTFDFFNTQVQAKDFFKNLYQVVMPSPVRHALGEYYTPYWLASHVSKKAIALQGNSINKKWRGLDRPAVQEHLLLP